MNPKLGLLITRMVPGGAAQIVSKIIRGLGADFDIDLITGAQDFPEDLHSKLTSVKKIDVLSSLVRDINPSKDLKTLYDLYNLFRRREYDLVHTHTSKAGILGRWAAWLAGIKKIVHTPHGLVYDTPDEIPGVPTGGLGLEILKRVERMTGTVHDAVTTLTDRERELCVELGLSDPTVTETIHNGVDLETFRSNGRAREDARKKFNLKSDDKLLASVGRLAREKGYDLLIEVFRSLLREHSQLKLVIAGTGPLSDLFQERAADLIESNRLFLPGYVEDVHSIYTAADVYVHPSRFEGFGLSIVEAMASGRPIVASRVGGVPELVCDGQEALLVEPGSPEELREALDRVLRNESLRDSLSRTARKRSEEFDSERMVQQYRDLYERLLKET
jgi:glycosyltransferase involved in cell wall biosynthesis